MPSGSESRRVTVCASILIGAVLLSAPSLVLAGETPPLFADGIRADLVVLEKAARRLSLYQDGRLLRSYRVALGRSPLGPKEREGDDRTPEGQYVIDRRNTRSAYHLALHISYPSPADVARARAGGYSPGGDIMVHGLPNGLGWIGASHVLVDWTRGCIAVTNAEIEEIARVVPDGTAIHLRP